MQPNKNIKFTPQLHALLFSSIVKAIFSHTDTKNGEQVISKAVKKYGRQRGKRMALRAQKNGHDVDFISYFAYGEWVAPENDMNLRIIEKTPDVRLNIFKCPWHTVWKENNLLDYGKYFCKDIDSALVYGFNPKLEIKINSTQTHGDDLCDFVFKNGNLTVFKLLGLAYKKKIKPGKTAIMPWDYHAGHLFKTMGGIINKELGYTADKIIENALIDFIKFCSADHIEIIQKYKNTNFDILP